MSGPKPVSKSKAKSTTGAILIAVGAACVVLIPTLMTGGDKGDAGLIYFLMGAPIGLLFGAIFIVAGIVTLAAKDKSESNEVPSPGEPEKTVKRLPLGD